MTQKLYLPAECSEPWKVIGMVNSVANGYDFLETFDLNTHNLQKKAFECNYTSVVEDEKCTSLVYEAHSAKK